MHTQLVFLSFATKNPRRAELAMTAYVKSITLLLTNTVINIATMNNNEQGKNEKEHKAAILLHKAAIAISPSVIPIVPFLTAASSSAIVHQRYVTPSDLCPRDKFLDEKKRKEIARRKILASCGA